MYLENLKDVTDIKKLNIKELKILAEEIRRLICSSIEENGGHLSSNLGIVELTEAIYYVFDLNSDKLVFDVGHQCYTHKILSGRKDAFDTLRQKDGISGFPDRCESALDAVSSGHTSTSLSLGLGLALGRNLTGEKFNVISVVGDGAMTGGQVFEALNNIGTSKTGLIMLLNDNEMSISKNVGIISKNLAKIRISKKYSSFKSRFENFLRHIPLIGKPLAKFFSFCKRCIKTIFAPNVVFEHFNVKYYGPVDGHNIKKLIKILNKVKDTDEPVLIHILTKKGKGNCSAEENPDIYHGIKKGNIIKNSEFSDFAGKTLLELAQKNEKIVAITAAMTDGTGLTDFAAALPKRFFDVGISEGHAVTFAAGLADTGLKPYFCVYSAFLQRAFDQISNDVCINKMPVTFLIDRSGLVGSDGKTHQGILDLSFLTCIPNLTIASPCDLKELDAMLNFSVTYDMPLAIRYCNDYAGEFESNPVIQPGKWSYIEKNDSKNTLVASGNRMISLAVQVSAYLKRKGISCNIINAKFIKPLDSALLDAVSDNKIAVIEDNILNGGLGSNILNHYNSVNKDCKIKIFAINDSYVPHGTIEELLDLSELNVKNIAKYFLN